MALRIASRPRTRVAIVVAASRVSRHTLRTSTDGRAVRTGGDAARTVRAIDELRADGRGIARMAPQPASVAAPPSPLEIARVLLERANTEKDLERRVTILNRAVAGLTRSVQTAPDDDALSELLTSTRAQLWQTWERIALARLAAAMPWNGEILAAETTTVLTRTR